MPGRTIKGESVGRKRRRAVEDDAAGQDEEGPEVDEVRQASSSLRHESSKRVRVSDEAARKAETRPLRRPSTPVSVSDDGVQDVDGDVEDDADDGHVASPPATQYEKLRDDGFRHLQHEAEDDQRATQKLRERPKLIGDNHAAENGILESITCVNFMCHERLQCDLGPLLNFIVGENGSGKSAILTAITLCLGGKPSSTNRGASLKSFIKEGRDQAVLTVRIKNQGVDAYRHDIYGDSIIIERHFSKSGSSSFKVKPAIGTRVISTKRQEVEEIVEYYCLQVDNPLNVLSQDNARQFLNAATPAMKYRFFIQGVQLEQLDNDYRIVQESAELVEARVQDYEETVLLSKKSLEQAKKLLELVKSNEELRRRRRHLGNQLAWAQVADQEKELDRRKEDIADIDRRLVEAQQVIETTSGDLESEDQRLRRAQEELETAKNTEIEGRGGVEDAQETFQALRSELDALHSDERDAHTRLKTAEGRVKRLEEQIRAEEKRIEEANGGAQTDKLRDLDEAKEAQASVESEIVAEEKRKASLTAEAAHVADQISKKREMVDGVRKQMGKVETDIDTLQRGVGSPFDGYEPQLPRLLQEIEKKVASFDSKPIGPIGSHIQLLEPRWSSILESTLGRTLNGFIVTSKRDQVTLQAMMERQRLFGSPILIANRHPINTAGKEPDESFQTVLRVLKIDDQLVRDQLIIHHAIEQIILIPDRAQGEDAMFDGPAPRNVQACICFHDSKPGVGLRLTARGSSGLVTAPIVPRDDLKPRMKASLDSRILARKEALAALQSDLRKHEAEKRTLEQSRQRLDAEVRKSGSTQTELKRKQRECDLAFQNIEDELEKFSGAEGKLLALRDERQAAENETSHHGNQYGDLAVKKQAKNKEVEAAQKALKAEKTKAKDCEAKVTKAEHKVQRCESTRSIALNAKNEAYADVDMLRDDKQRAEAKRDRQEETVAQFSLQAAEVTPDRVHIGEDETYATVQRKYDEVTRQIKEREDKAGMTDEQIHGAYIDAKKRHDECLRHSGGAKAVCQELKNTLAQRLAKWRRFQRHISAASRVNFLYLLSERGFRGALILDHEQRKLTLRVEPDETKRSASGRNTKTLSGGEKSFSSICLLLAIWEAMGSPLRCLDEFDVFMDNVNRAISTNMLITAARRSVGRQYILITPNAIEGSSHREKDVRITRLVDPRQRTLTGLSVSAN